MILPEGSGDRDLSKRISPEELILFPEMLNGIFYFELNKSIADSEFLRHI